MTSPNPKENGQNICQQKVDTPCLFAPTPPPTLKKKDKTKNKTTYHNGPYTGTCCFFVSITFFRTKQHGNKIDRRFFRPFPGPAPPMPLGMGRSHLIEKKRWVFPTKKIHRWRTFQHTPKGTYPRPRTNSLCLGIPLNLGGWGGLGYAPFGVCLGFS